MAELEDSTAPKAAICGDASASAYLFAVWNLIVRPPRARYSEEELAGDYPRTRFTVCGQPALRSDFELVSAHGVRIVCTLFEPLVQGEGPDARRGAGERACVVFCHDSCSCRLAGFQLVPVFLPLNIGLACFDFAGSGRSGGENVSFGFHERDDLSCVIDYLRRVYGFSRIGLWGQTMGAAAALMHAPRDPTIAGVVADSPFIDVWTLLTEVCSNVVSLPPWLISPYLHMVRLIIKNQANFDICEVSPEAHAKKCFVPALFLHGEMNTFVVPRHSEQLQRSYGGEARLLRMPGVAHSSKRPGGFLAKAAAFLVRALHWEQHLPPGITEETLAALSAGRPLQTLRAEDGSLEARRTCSLPQRGVLQLLAAPSARSRCLGLVRAACEFCNAYRGARYLTAALPGGKASPYRTACCPAELTGRLAFLADGAELAFSWVCEGAAAEDRAVVAFAMLSPTAVSLTRVTVLRCDAESKCNTLGCDSLSGLSCEPVETLGFDSLSLELHSHHTLCLRVSKDEAFIAVDGMTLAAPLPGDGRLHLWCFHWIPAEASARPGASQGPSLPRVQLELGGEAEPPRAVATAGQEAQAKLDCSMEQLGCSMEQLGRVNCKLPLHILPSGNSGIPSYTLPSETAGLPLHPRSCDKAATSSQRHMAESLANICYGMQSPPTPWKAASAKIEVETQTTLQLSRSRSGSQTEEEPPKASVATASASAAAVASPVVPSLTDKGPGFPDMTGEANANFPESGFGCEEEGLPWGPTTCPPGLDCKSRTLPHEFQMPPERSSQGQPTPEPAQMAANGAPPPAKGAPPPAKGATPPAKGATLPAKGATLPAKGAAKGKGGPPKGAGKGKGKGKAATGDAGKGCEPRQPEVLPRVPLKRLFWTPISLSGAEEGTVWERVHRLGAHFDRDELEALFAKAAPGPSEAGNAGVGQASMAMAERERGQPRRVLEEQRRRQVWCMLALMPQREATLEAIVTMDDSVLMPEKVDLLLANLPAPAEESLLRTAAAGAAASSEDETVVWDAPEAFLMRLVDIPMYALRVKAWAFLNAFQGGANRLATAEADCRMAGEYLQTSEHIEHLLAVILHVGNYLNGGTARGRADGFELDSLTKLGELKTCQRSTLLDFIVAQMERDHTGMLEEIFATGREFDSIHRARRHKMSELREDLSSLLSQAEDFVRRMNCCISDGDGFLERPCLQLQAHVAHLKVLAERFDGWNTCYASLCTWFRIDAGKQMPTDEFFGIWDTFLVGVRTAREATGRRRGRGPCRASSTPAPGAREQRSQDRSDSSAGARRQPAKKRSERAVLPPPSTPRRPPGPRAPRAGSAPPREAISQAA